jgi:hypothetical protein
MTDIFDDEFFYRRLVPNCPKARPVAPERESAEPAIDGPQF